MARFCNKYFHPELYPENTVQCKKLNTETGYCFQKPGFVCVDEIELTRSERIILQNLRTIKLQNAEILRQLTGRKK